LGLTGMQQRIDPSPCRLSRARAGEVASVETVVISATNPGQIITAGVSSNALLDIGCTFSTY